MKEKIESKYFSAIVAAIVAIIIFCVISVIFGIMPINGLPASYMGAALGSLIGALITLILLRGQTAIEEKKGKDIKILEKKIYVFQKFINAVWEVWEKQIITIEVFQNLTSQYYKNLMIYLDEEKVKTIGNALTEMGSKIEKSTYEDTVALRRNIVKIIDTLSKEIKLGGRINEDIMDEHDKIVFPLLFRKQILDKLNESLNIKDETSIFNKGKYEIIWEGEHREFITFELNKYHGVKLAFGPIGSQKGDIRLKMVFMADRNIQQLDEFRKSMYGGSEANRLKWEIDMFKAIETDTDKTEILPLDFYNTEHMEKFRTEKRDFPDILAKRVFYHCKNWNTGIEGIGIGIKGIIEFLDKCLSVKEEYDVK
jgi:hypothetical protein